MEINEFSERGMNERATAFRADAVETSDEVGAGCKRDPGDVEQESNSLLPRFRRQDYFRRCQAGADNHSPVTPPSRIGAAPKKWFG